MTLVFIPLDQLRFGHEASPPINVRKVGREAELESLAASLHAHGLGQALNVREIDGVHYVADGNRRLAALRFNADKGLLASDAEIRCEKLGDDAGDELSLALNIERVPMHEADQYEKFAELRSKGLGEDDIALRFGLDVRRVHRILALGRLHPDILEAWRNDEFVGGHAVETIRAFTLAPSQKAQQEVFARLREQGKLSWHWVREAFGAGNTEAVKLLTFVGSGRYRAAGGKMVEDLFGEHHAISNYDLLKDLADQRLSSEMERLRADGWSWVALEGDLPSGSTYSWQKVRPETTEKPSRSESAELKELRKVVGKTSHWDQNEDQRAAAARIEEIEEGITGRSFTEDEKARAGVAVGVNHRGCLSRTFGLVKPAATKKAAKATGDGEPAAPAISNAMMHRLSVQLTQAAGDAIAASPKTALAAVLAGLAFSNAHGYPICVRAGGLLREPRARSELFQDLLDALLSKSTEELLAALAHEARFMVDLQTNHASQAPLATPVKARLVEALEPAAMQEALRRRFDAEDYFKTVPRALTVTAIGEALNEDEARKAAKLKKGELVDFALANVPGTGWLPPELRTSTYAGPSAAEMQEAAE